VRLLPNSRGPRRWDLHGVEYFWVLLNPIYYLPAGYLYTDHKDVAERLMQSWLSNTRTRLMVLPPRSPINASVPDYRACISDHPDWFSQTGSQLEDGFAIVAVHVPVATPVECAQAARDAAVEHAA
jgi:hypothetical protein